MPAFFKFSRNEILKANYHKYTNVEVFHYISDITGKRIKPGAIKKYYYDKFKILVRFEKQLKVTYSNSYTFNFVV